MKSFKSNAWPLPQTVLIFGIYDQEVNPDAMNAARGGKWNCLEMTGTLWI